MDVSPEVAKFGALIRRRLGLLNSHELAATLECSVDAVYSWRKLKTGPRFCRLGRRVYYRELDVQEWAASQADKEEGSDAEDEQADATPEVRASLPPAVAARGRGGQGLPDQAPRLPDAQGARS